MTEPVPSDSFITRLNRRAGERVSPRVAELVADGKCVIVDNFVTARLAESLRQGARRRWADEEFRHARVGAGENAKLRTEVRTDRVHWLEEDAMNAAEREYRARLEVLRKAMNQQMYLGLFEWEGHLAMYPPGSFYRRHRDRFVHDPRRTLTTVLYLNHAWKPGDGGELRVWSSEEPDASYVDVAPESGRLAVFMSEHVDHAVIQSQFERLSITGWFRRR